MLHNAVTMELITWFYAFQKNNVVYVFTVFVVDLSNLSINISVCFIFFLTVTQLKCHSAYIQPVLYLDVHMI